MSASTLTANTVVVEKEEHETWQTVLLCFAFAFYFIAGVYIYWITSDEYQIRKYQKKLGYEVPSLWSYFRYCCICCWGPAVRRKWERENKFFRTPDYGNINQAWQGKYLNNYYKYRWGRLPRGDMKQITKLSLSQAEAKVIETLFNWAIKQALDEVQREADRDERRRGQLQRLRRKTEMLQLTEEDIKQIQRTEFTKLVGEAHKSQAAIESSSEEEEADDMTDWAGATVWGKPTFNVSNTSTGMHAEQGGAAAASGGGGDGNAPQAGDEWVGSQGWGGAADIVPNPKAANEKKARKPEKAPKEPKPKAEKRNSKGHQDNHVWDAEPTWGMGADIKPTKQRSPRKSNQNSKANATAQKSLEI